MSKITMKELFNALPTNPKLLSSMVNGTISKPRAYFPKVEKVIFNDGVVKENGEVLERGATIVFFADGTRTVVRRMDGDADNKETALLYALVKRLFATSLDISNGEVGSAGLGRMIQDTVARATYQKKVVKEKQKPAEVAAAPKATTPEKVKPWPKPSVEKKLLTETKNTVTKTAVAENTLKRGKVVRNKDGKFASKKKA